MLKTREEVYEWLLKHPMGFYKELECVAGRVLAKQLELLGYIRRDKKEFSHVYSLTERGKRVIKTTIRLVALEKEKPQREITNFEYLLSKF